MLSRLIGLKLFGVLVSSFFDRAVFGIRRLQLRSPVIIILPSTSTAVFDVCQMIR